MTGCDSTWTLTVTVNPLESYSDSVTICYDALPYEFHGHEFTTGGTQTGTVPSTVTGCDSTWTLTVTGSKGKP